MIELYEKRVALYFDSCCEMINYTKVVSTAAANVAYFDPNVQKWTMIENEK